VDVGARLADHDLHVVPGAERHVGPVERSPDGGGRGDRAELADLVAGASDVQLAEARDLPAALLGDGVGQVAEAVVHAVEQVVELRHPCVRGDVGGLERRPGPEPARPADGVGVGQGAQALDHEVRPLRVAQGHLGDVAAGPRAHALARPVGPVPVLHRAGGQHRPLCRADLGGSVGAVEPGQPGAAEVGQRAPAGARTHHTGPGLGAPGAAAEPVVGRDGLRLGGRGPDEGAGRGGGRGGGQRERAACGHGHVAPLRVVVPDPRSSGTPVVTESYNSQ
jgi:hypothetical protein